MGRRRTKGTSACERARARAPGKGSSSARRLPTRRARAQARERVSVRLPARAPTGRAGSPVRAGRATPLPVRFLASIRAISRDFSRNLAKSRDFSRASWCEKSHRRLAGAVSREHPAHAMQRLHRQMQWSDCNLLARGRSRGRGGSGRKRGRPLLCDAACAA